jgi:hypothetical protein
MALVAVYLAGMSDRHRGPAFLIRTTTDDALLARQSKHHGQGITHKAGIE